MGTTALCLSTRSPKAARAALLRGELNEQRALRAALRLRDCWWFLAARRTRQNDQWDRWGIDLVVETVDLGNILVQVKSNEADAEKFRQHGRTLDLKYRIHTVVVNDAMTAGEVYGRILGTCILAREEALARCLTCDDARLCPREDA